MFLFFFRGIASAKNILTVYVGVYHPPEAVFSKLDCSTTKAVPISNDNTSSESSRRDVFNAELFWHGHYDSKCGDINHGTSAQGGLVLYIPSYTVLFVIFAAELCLAKRILSAVRCPEK